MKKTLSAAQAAKAAERKAHFRALWKQVASMPECERAAKFEHLPFVNVEGHAFSIRNMMMLVLQGGGTVFGGFRQWIGQGRAVRKGEHGKMILVPIGSGKHTDAATGEETAGEVHFICGTVFDISQTDEVETDTVTEVSEAEFETRAALETAKCTQEQAGVLVAA